MNGLRKICVCIASTTSSFLATIHKYPAKAEGRVSLIYLLLARFQAYRKLIRLAFCLKLSNRENSTVHPFFMSLKEKVSDKRIYCGLALDMRSVTVFIFILDLLTFTNSLKVFIRRTPSLKCNRAYVKPLWHHFSFMSLVTYARDKTRLYFLFQRALLHSHNKYFGMGGKIPESLCFV